MRLLDRIIAFGAEGYHAHPDCVPDWEGLALVAFPALIILGACVADALRGVA